MQVHFTSDVSLGQVIVGIPITLIIGILLKMYGMLLNFRMEHEILMQDWAARQNPPILLNTLPTRMKRWW